MGTALSLLLVTVTVASLLLQLRTVRRVGTAGLASSTWFGLVAVALLWLGYGVATGDLTVVVTNLVVLVVALRLALELLRVTPVAPARLVVYVAGPAVVWCGAWVAEAPWLLGVAGTAVVIVRMVPQVVRAVEAADRSGISLGSWLGNAAVNGVWALYGVEIGDALVWVSSLWAAALSLVIAALVLAHRPPPALPRPRASRRRRRSDPQASPA